MTPERRDRPPNAEPASPLDGLRRGEAFLDVELDRIAPISTGPADLR
jgi:hypothetical protein